MTEHSSASIPKPKDWQDFERNSKVLFEIILNDIHVQNNGRTGQPQHGVDIFGRRNGEGTKWVGIQCKGKNDDYGNELTESELRKEVEKSRNFEPKISDFILITTAPVDSKIQLVARKIIEERENEGNPLSVSVWGWGELEVRISEYPRALKAFHPDVTLFTDQLLQNDADHTEMLQAVFQSTQRIECFVQANDPSSAATELLDKHIHADIDAYRDILKEGRPETAMRFLKDLKNRIWGTASDRIKFRIITNIGASLIRLERNDEAAGLLLEARAYQPEDPLALANYALAYLLKGDAASAVSEAKKALEKSDANDGAASCLIQACIKDETIRDPLTLAPEKTRGSIPVDIACIHFLRARDNRDWITTAQEALVRHPEDAQIKRFAAEAELENVLTTKGVLGGEKPLIAINFEGLNWASNILREIWETQTKGEEPVTDPSIPCNLAQTYMVLGKNDEASRIASLAYELMPESLEVIKLRAHIYLEYGDTKNALKLLRQNQNDPESLLLAAEILERSDPTAALGLLDVLEGIGSSKPYHNIMEIYLRVECLLTNKKMPEQERIGTAEALSNTLLGRFPSSPLAHIVCSRIYQARNDDEGRRKTLANAKTLLNSESPFYERCTLAYKFEELDCYSDVVDILNGYVNSAHDTPALRTLFVALINDHQRTCAHELLTSLPEEVAFLPFFLKAATTLHFQRGDYPSAENAISRVLELYPNDLGAYLNRVDLCIRNRNDQAIIEFLSGDVERFNGKPEEKIKLVQLLNRFGFSERALKLGYRVHLENLHNHTIQLAYIGLLLTPDFPDEINLERTTVGEETAFSIKNASDETQTFVIELEETLRLVEEAIPPTHPFAVASFGLTAGQRFVVKGGEEWEIIWVKHKYLHSLHSRMERFERLFPECGGLQKIKIRDDVDGKPSFDPMFRMIKERHDACEKTFDIYSEFPLPLEIFSQQMGSNIIETWHGLIETSHKFKVCVGNSIERSDAIKCLKENNGRGCVVDALTLHVIRLLGIEETVTAICGPIAVTESTIDIFRFRREQVLVHGKKPFMTMSWRDGRYYREDITKDRLDEVLTNIESELDWINQRIEVLPAESTAPIPVEAIRLRDALSYSFLDPILAVQEADILLLCEDMSYRQFSSREFKIKTSWLQPLLMLAHDRGILSQEDYCKAVCALVNINHSFTSVDTQTLLYALTESEKSFEKVANTLYGKDAEIYSHLSVTLDFFNNIWRAKPINLDGKRATSLLLGRILSEEWVGNTSDIKAKDIYSHIYKDFKKTHLGTYMHDWLQGHFLIPFRQTKDQKALSGTKRNIKQKQKR